MSAKSRALLGHGHKEATYILLPCLFFLIFSVFFMVYLFHHHLAFPYTFRRLGYIMGYTPWRALLLESTALDSLGVQQVSFWSGCFLAELTWLGGWRS